MLLGTARSPAALAMLGVGMKRVHSTFALLMLAAGCSTAPPLQGKPSDTQLSLARARWREHRTVEDFLLIVQHIPAGTPGERVVSDYLGVPLRKQHMHAMAPTEWYYTLARPPDGPVCTVFISQSDGTFLYGRDKRSTEP